MSEQERKIVEVKYLSEMISKMSVAKLQAVAGSLLVKIHVITGWNFPEDVEYQNILKDQFCKFLVENYSNVNCDEVEFSFRKYAVKDWGKNMNLNLISEVLEQYIENRFEVSRLEEILKKPKELPAPVEQISDEEIIQVAKDIWNATKNYMYISTKAYDVLYNAGKLKVSDHDRARIKAMVKIKLDIMLLEDSDLFKDIPREKMELRICKKIAVAEFFNL